MLVPEGHIAKCSVSTEIGERLLLVRLSTFQGGGTDNMYYFRMRFSLFEFRTTFPKVLLRVRASNNDQEMLDFYILCDILGFYSKINVLQCL